MYQFDFKDVRPSFSGHETFPLRYGWLKKAYDQLYLPPQKSSGKQYESKDAREVFNSEEAISYFGVGKNMVSSIRHWATQMGVINDNQLTDFAFEFFDDEGLDPWLEHTNTLWILHWFIARNPQLVSYFWLFNFFNGSSFSRATFAEEIEDFCAKNELTLPAQTTLKRDIECVIRLYSERSHEMKKGRKAKIDDNLIESPLAELGLIVPIQKQGFFALNWQNKPSISPNLFLLVLIYFWKTSHTHSSSISLESLLYDPLSPGRIFLLDDYSFIEKIYEAESHFAPYFNWTETTGMRQLIKKADVDLETAYAIIREQFVKEYE